MNPLQKIRLATKRNLWRQAKGFIYHQSPEQIQIPDDFLHRDVPPLNLLDIDAIHSTEGWSCLDRNEIKRRHAKGDLCYGHRFDDEVVLLRWISTTSNFIRGVNLLITLDDHEWYCYGIITKPTARGQGLYKLAQCQTIELARQFQIRNLVAYVEAQNPIPQKIYQRLNYKTTPPITTRRLLGVQFGNHYDTRTDQITRQITNRIKKHPHWI